MTKKQSNQNPPNQGGLKKGKIKRKQMFNQLQTLQQQKIIQNQDQSSSYIQDAQQIKIQQQDDIKLQKFNNGQEKNVQDICQAVNQLMAKNKIGVKNAFDVPIVDLFDLINFNKNESQNTWKTLSSTFQNDSKIYAYRVDAIHSIAYSILNIMSRRSVQTQQKLKPQLHKNLQTAVHSDSFIDLKDSFFQSIDSNKTFLQADINKLNLQMIQCNMTNDPALQRTKRLFDQPGLKGMLTNSIPINNNLQLSLSSHVNHQPYSMKLSQIDPIDFKSIDHPLKVFDSISHIKSDLSKILGVTDSQNLTHKQLQQIWCNVKKCNFNDWADESQRIWLDVQDPQYRQKFDMMIDENQQNNGFFQNPNRKFIGQFIKMKNQPKKVMTDQQMMLDGQRFLNEIDKKFLGIKSSSNPNKNQSVQKKPIRSADDVNFNDFQIFQRDEIIRKQVPPKQIHEQIQDRFLMTIRPVNQFKIQKILTVRVEPQVQLKAIEQEFNVEENHQHFLEKQIDVKRQMTSIKEIKQTIYDELQKQKTSSFNKVYESYLRRDEQVSPALCFLTLLHLANEKNLSFESIANETNFIIKLP